MDTLQHTALFEKHVACGGKMVDFAGWEMPLHYPTGILQEHLATRKRAGLFDVSHMGRFRFRGAGAVPFLQHVLSNNVEALEVGQAHYTFIPNATGGALDDAYLYRFSPEEYLLVVNAANRRQDWEHFEKLLPDFPNVQMSDVTPDLVMLALQGPQSRALLLEIIPEGAFPPPQRNALSLTTYQNEQLMIARTGYTGEPLCFELFISPAIAGELWDRLINQGAAPVGLGARDTLRLEAALPLYGHELGQDAEGKEIPIFACPLAKAAVSFAPAKGDFIGHAPLTRQAEANKKILLRDYSLRADLPRRIKPVALVGEGIARAGARVFKGGKFVGYVTSGTMIPSWITEGEGLLSTQSHTYQLRAVCLAYVDCDVVEDDAVTIDVRGKLVNAVVVAHHLRSDAPPVARPILHRREAPAAESPEEDMSEKIRILLTDTIANTRWRQQECINLIPSEMTLSPMARLLSIMDPAFRYAEHQKVKAFYDTEVFYYQGTKFIQNVEALLERELGRYLACREVETRLISGQMANVAVFSALVNHLNRAESKREPRRIARVLNHHIQSGGHLSAQPMGALRDYVSYDARTERPAIMHFPVLPDNPYKTDVPATLNLIAEYRPELIIFGKSMVLHKEPVAEIRRFIDEQGIEAVIMYDMAHVLGLVGPYFQQPFGEGADLVTGSTHKTFFGTQRGLVATNLEESAEQYKLWEALRKRTFPGAVSNHHLGTMLGLLMAAYEMNHFKQEYQQKILANAKAFAQALHDCGLRVAGDPAISFTETHQVIVEVGYSRAPEIAERLERNNIICNYQATPEEEGFTAAGALRLGVSEMTRFGMEAGDFRLLAALIKDAIVNDAGVLDAVIALRKKFQELRFCFSQDDYAELIQALHRLI